MTADNLTPEDVAIRLEDQATHSLDTDGWMAAAEFVRSQSRRIAELEKQKADWISANGPGGWIDDLRKQSSETRAHRADETSARPARDASNADSGSPPPVETPKTQGYILPTACVNLLIETAERYGREFVTFGVQDISGLLPRYIAVVSESVAELRDSLKSSPPPTGFKSAIEITGHQAQRIVEYCGGSFDVDLAIAYFDATKCAETGEDMESGLYVWCAEYPEEGQTFVPDEPLVSDESTIGPSEATNRFNKAAIARLSNEPPSPYCTCPPDYPQHMGHHPDCVSQRVDEPSETCCTCQLTFCRGDPGDGCYCRIKPPVVETSSSQPCEFHKVIGCKMLSCVVCKRHGNLGCTHPLCTGHDD